jgi:hypothetical protein
MRTVDIIATVVVLTCMAGTALGQPPLVPIRVVVKQKDLKDPVPFPRVAGFTIMRNNLPFANASCPDASDSNGELTCTLICPSTDKNATLLLMPPKRERSSVVAGMKVPAAYELKVADCRVVTRQPVELVYKTVTAQLAELQVTSPAVFRAATTVSNGKLQVKPFSAASRDLEVLAQNEEHRKAIRELGELSRLAAERERIDRQGDGKESILMANMADYAVGTNSVLLKAQASDAIGPDAAAKLVNLSPEPVELDKSITRVTKTLSAKPVLNKNELQLERAAKAIANTRTLSSTRAAF